MLNWPKLYKIKQIYNHPVVEDIEEETKKQLEYIISSNSLSKGSKIAITVGSRGINNIVIILRTIVKKLQAMGYKPFLFSAMGSHGGATIEGQREILRSLGITEANIGCDIKISLETIKIGVTNSGIANLPVYVAKEAYDADGVILVNRVKAHTSFSGTYESGLVKMLAVGMGRERGASTVHQLGAEYLAEAIPAIANIVLQKTTVLGGIALIENGRDETAKIVGLRKDEIFPREPLLLNESKSYLPRIPFTNIDFAVILEMGKNYSGTGMDTNVIGRIRIGGISEPTEPDIKYLAVLGLSEESHGNATGIGLADFTTEEVVNKIDKKATYLNCLTSGFVQRAAIPMTFKDDNELFEAVYPLLNSNDNKGLKILIMKNTLHLDEMWISEALIPKISASKNIIIDENPININYKKGKLTLN